MTCIAASLPARSRALNEGARLADPLSVQPTSALVRRLRPQVEAVLDRLRPALLVDGGNVELVGLDDAGVASIVFQGACATCPAQLATLRFVVAPAITSEVPAITQVVPVAPSA